MLLDSIFGWTNEETRSTRLPVSGARLDQESTLQTVFDRRGLTTSGVEVTAETPLTVSGWYAAVRLLAWTTGYLPLKVFESLPNNEREVRPDHPLSPLLGLRPNPDMSAMQYRATSMVHVILWGNSFAWQERDAGGQVVHLWPLDPDGVHVGRFSRTNGRRGELAYDITSLDDPPTSKKVLTAEEVVHVPGLGFNGIVGRSVVSFAREHIGEAVAAQQYGAGHFAEGHRPDLVFSHPAKLKSRKGFRDRWKSQHGSAVRRIPILDEGMELKAVPNSMPLKDMVYIDARQFLVTDAARWLGVPPHKIADLIRATNANIVEQNIEWKQSLVPWMRLFEQEYNHKSFTAVERGRFFVEHITEALLQGDPAAQDASFAHRVQNGINTRNQVRRVLNQRGMGPAGDVYTVQSNLQPLDQLGKQPPESVGEAEQNGGEPDSTAKLEPTEGRSEITATRQAWFEDSFRSLLRMEVQELRRAADTPGRFIERLDKLFDALPTKARKYLRAAGEETGVDVAGIVTDHCRTAHAAMLELAGEVVASQLPARVEEETRAWLETLPAQLASAVLRKDRDRER